MNAVERFLQNGTLPFIGRQRESDQIVDLWRGSVDAGRLRGMMLSAEAGAGKSRLLEEVISRIREEGGAVVHAKLYPDAANDLADTIVGAVSRDPSLRKIYPERGVDDVGSAIDMLRRIGRLRRTLLVVEDMHLLPEDAHPELEHLLRGLADETCAFLIITRPLEMGARGVLEPYLVASSDLNGLDTEEIAGLWSELFGTEIKGARLKILEQKTLGNPLALRSALRGVIEAGAVQPRGAGKEWKLVVSTELFTSVVQQSVALFVEGLLSGLGAETRAGAVRVAMLGEVVAREAATSILGDSRILDELIDANLLVPTSHPVAPLVAVDGDREHFRALYPTTQFPLLVFTHSLVQNRLREEILTLPKELVTLVADSTPLYSLVPFNLLQSLPIASDVESDALSRAIRRTGVVAQLLDRTLNWREGQRLWQKMKEMVDLLADKVTPEKFRWWRVWWHVSALSLLGRRELGSPEWVALLRDAEELSDMIENREIAYSRLLVVCHTLEYEGRGVEGDAILEKTDRMVEEILQRWPDFVRTPGYVYYLDTVGGLAGRFSDEKILRYVDEKANQLLDRDDLPDHLRSLAHYRLLKYGLGVFRTPEELVDRYRVMERIEEEVDEEDGYYGLKKVEFLLETGAMEETVDLAGRVLQSCRDLGLWKNHLLCFGAGEIARNGLRYDRDRVIESVRFASALELSKAGDEDRERKIIGMACLISLMSGDSELVYEVLKTTGRTTDDLQPSERILLGLVSGNRELTGDFGGEGPSEFVEVSQSLWDLWRDALSENPSVVRPQLVEQLENPPLRFSHIFQMLIGLRVSLMMSDDESFPGTAADACESNLHWLFSRQVFGYAPSIIALLGDLGCEKQAAQWQERLEELTAGEIVPDEESASDEEGGGEEKSKIRVSMIGTIGIALPPDDYAPLRGSRLRMILGLLAAGPLLERGLDSAEFVRLAGGADSDAERSRKKKNMGIIRLREVLGRDAISTEGEIPHLDQNLVEIDIVEVMDRVAEAEEALRSGSIVRALPLLRKGLDRLVGEVPFPTLYDDFFEAVRSDIDHRIRGVLIRAGELMLREGEVAETIKLLGTGLQLLPEDEEIGELLADALHRNGEEVEAERVRMKISAT